MSQLVNIDFITDMLVHCVAGIVCGIVANKICVWLDKQNFSFFSNAYVALALKVSLIAVLFTLMAQNYANFVRSINASLPGAFFLAFFFICNPNLISHITYVANSV